MHARMLARLAHIRDTRPMFGPRPKPDICQVLRFARQAIGKLAMDWMLICPAVILAVRLSS